MTPVRHVFGASRIAAWALVLILSSCATPRLDYPAISQADVSASTEEAQRQAIQTGLASHARLMNLAWPLIRDNADLCGERTRKTLGVVVADVSGVDSIVGGLTRNQIRALGYEDDLNIVAVAEDSPAHAAGLQVGQHIVGVNGVDVEDASLAEFSEILSETAEDKETITLIVEDDDGRNDVTLAPVDVCNVAIRLRRSREAAAYTNGREIVMTEGFIDLVGDDAQLRFVIGHELAHVIERHVRKGVRNGVVTGAFVYGPLLAIPAALGDEVLEWVWIRPQNPPLSTALSHAVAASMGTQNFEREADYLGLYLYARTGADLDGVEDIWTVLANANPRATWGPITHPTSPERRLALQATRTEIEAKRAAGQPLVPEGWPTDD